VWMNVVFYIINVEDKKYYSGHQFIVKRSHSLQC
jgi:hypothetical protein